MFNAKRSQKSVPAAVTSQPATAAAKPRATERVASAIRLEGEKIKTNMMNMPIASLLLAGLAGIGIMTLLAGTRRPYTVRSL